MFRTFSITFLATLITAALAAVFLFRDNEVNISDNRAVIGGLPAGRQGLPKITPLSELKDTEQKEGQALLGGQKAWSDPPFQDVHVHFSEADKYLEEALLLTDPKQRFILIEKINNFEDAYTFAFNSSGSDPDELKVMMRATARYIAEWSPFYYKIHPDASAVLGRVIKNLEEKRLSMLAELVNKNPELAGQLAAEDIEYYIEDIRKSAARRNSDFITFSLLDYWQYRETFDTLASAHEEFLFGFAKNAHILFDDFYRMHEEVDFEYMEKTREKVYNVRLNIRDLHRQALLELNDIDGTKAEKALNDTISVIKKEQAANAVLRDEIHDIMNSDYEFYKAIKL